MTKKMSKIIETIQIDVAKLIHHTDKLYRLNYFERYAFYMDDDELRECIVYIDKNYEHLGMNSIDDMANIASIDTNNITSSITEQKYLRYITYLIVMAINDYKYATEYQLDDTIMLITGKSRPDTYIGTIITDDVDINIRIKPVVEYNYNKHINGMISTLINCKTTPMPYCRELENFIITEECDRITDQDPIVEVMKDLTNQFKGITKYFWVEYFDMSFIGKSRTGANRYFLYNFDSIIHKGEEFISFNPYTGYAYTKLTYQNQLITIVNVLAEIYHSNSNVKPFSNYIEFIQNSMDGHHIFDKLIQFLMGIKNEH